MTDKPLTTVLAPTVDMQVLFDKAIEKESPLEVIRALNEMCIEQRKWQAEQAFNEDMAALQAELPIVEKNCSSTSEAWAGFDFAPLETILPIVQPLLTKHGFSFQWDQVIENETLTVTCFAKHKLGHRESSKASSAIEPQAKMNKVQSSMSTDTYCARRAFQRVFGIITKGEDNDGGPPSEPITEVQLDILISMTEGYISTWQTDSKEITKLRKVWMRGLARKAGVKGTKPEAADISSSAFDRSKEWLEAKFKQDKEQREGQ